MKNSPKNYVHAVILMTTISFNTANAQVVYTDVVPDSTRTSGTYNLDINNDGITDFVMTITISSVGCSGIGALCHGTNRTLSIAGIGTNGVSGKLNQHAVIDTNMLYSSPGYTLAKIQYSVVNPTHTCMGAPTSCHVNGPVRSGNWSGTVTDKYLGLRFTANSNIYYGWVRLDVASYNSMSFTVKDYAYDSIPGQSIFAGDNCWFPVGLNVAGNNDFCVYDTINHSTTFNASGGTSYLWSTGQTTAGITVSPAQTTNYSVSVNDGISGCSAIFNQAVTIEIIDTTVTVYNLSYPAWLYAHNASNTSYQWMDCVTMLPVPGATGYYYGDSISGIYSVIITRNGCIDTSACYTVNIIANVNENISSNFISIYSDNKVVTIQMIDNVAEHGNITISNALGQQLRKIKIEHSLVQIDLSDCTGGIYFVSMQNKSAVEVRKIILK